MRNLRGYLTAGIFAGLTLLFSALAKRYSLLLESFYPFMSRTIMDFLATLSAPFAGSFWQTIVMIFLALLAVSIGVMIFTRYNFFRWLGWVAAAVSVVAFLFMGVYGLNYYCGPISEDLHLEVTDYKQIDLKDAAKYYQDKANELASQAPREGGELVFEDFDLLAAQAPEGYKNLTQHYSVFGGTDLPVKPLSWTNWYEKMGITGVTVGLTGEACVNPEVFPTLLPFTMCHEMAHRKAIVREDDANFAAFLACDANSDAQFQYSGYFMAYLYCKTALQETDSMAAGALTKTESELLSADLAAYEAYVARYQGTRTQERASKLNDRYLKALGQEEGVASYDGVADLLVNWYIQKLDPDRVVEEDDEPRFDPLHPEEFQPTEPEETTEETTEAA